MSLLQADGPAAENLFSNTAALAEDAAGGRLVATSVVREEEEEEGWGLARRLHLSRMFLAGLGTRAVRPAETLLAAVGEDDGPYRAMARDSACPTNPRSIPSF